MKQSIKQLIYTLILAGIVACLWHLPNPVHAQPMIPASTGQQAVTGSAVTLPTRGTGVVCLKGVPGNALTIYVGLTASVTTSTGYPLAASESLCTQVMNLGSFYVIASSTGSSISWVTFTNGTP